MCSNSKMCNSETCICKIIETSNPPISVESSGESNHADRLLTIDQAARMLGMSTRWIFKQLQHGRLARIKLGSSTRVREADLQHLIERGTTVRSSTNASIPSLIIVALVILLGVGGCQSEVKQASHTVNMIRETARSSELHFASIQHCVAQDEPDLTGIASHAAAGMQEQRRIQFLAGGIQERLTQVQDRQSPWVPVLKVWGFATLALTGTGALIYFGGAPVLAIIGRSLTRMWTVVKR
jgi:excisionase family DNA binding protein